jgi:hypothetical protein
MWRDGDVVVSGRRRGVPEGHVRGQLLHFPQMQLFQSRYLPLIAEVVQIAELVNNLTKSKTDLVIGD